MCAWFLIVVSDIKDNEYNELGSKYCSMTRHKYDGNDLSLNGMN